jgi:hypothetical protein
MVICFNATHEAKLALDSLIDSGQFKDTSEAISMALINYEVIQRAVKENREVIRADTVPASESAHVPGQFGAGRADLLRFSERVSVSSFSNLPRKIPAMFQLPERRPSEEDMLLVTPAQAEYKSFSPKEWLFGQWNRFLPVKATTRALLNIMCEHHSGIPVSDAANKISYAACDLGDYLRMLDARFARRREDSVSAAFPSTTQSGAEGRLRYGNQFVGSIKQGKLIGLPAALRLIAHDSAKDPNLRLTKAGALFAVLSNPVLEHDSTGSANKFTTDEIHFLLEHIRTCVPEEVSAFVAIIDAINDGANTPDKMDASLRARFGLKDEASMTATFLSTQRTGAISRLADLGLIYREKAGLRVTYTVSHPGKCFRSQIS